MYGAVIVVHAIVSVAFILIVLLQAGKGTGIANVFGGAGQTVFGARTGDVLATGTSVCAGVFMLTSLGLAMLSSDRSGSVMRRSRLPLQEAPMLPSSGKSGSAGELQQQTMEKLRAIMSTVKDSAAKAAAMAGNTAPTATPGQPAKAPVAQPAPVALAQPVKAPAAQPAPAAAAQPVAAKATAHAPAQ